MAKARVVDRDLGWRELVQRSREIKNSYVEVGIFDSGKGAEEREGGVTNAELGAIHEFGTNTIPSRSFMRSTFDEKRTELVELGKKLIGGVVGGALDTGAALDILGATLATETKKKITAGPPLQPPLAASTLKRRDPNREYRIAKAESALGAAQRKSDVAAANQQEREAREQEKRDKALARFTKATERFKKKSKKMKTFARKHIRFHKAKKTFAKAMARSERASERAAAGVDKAVSRVAMFQHRLEKASRSARPLVDTGSMVNSITWVSHVRGRAE